MYIEVEVSCPVPGSAIGDIDDVPVGIGEGGWNSADPCSL